MIFDGCAVASAGMAAAGETGRLPSRSRVSGALFRWNTRGKPNDLQPLARAAQLTRRVERIDRAFQIAFHLQITVDKCFGRADVRSAQQQISDDGRIAENDRGGRGW